MQKLLALATAVALPIFSQQVGGTKPSFEVASVKPSAAGDIRTIGPRPGGRFIANSATLKTPIAVAYDVPEFSATVLLHVPLKVPVGHGARAAGLGGSLRGSIEFRRVPIDGQPLEGPHAIAISGDSGNHFIHEPIFLGALNFSSHAPDRFHL